MKKIICFIMTLALLLSSLSIAYAKQGSTKEQTKQQKKTEQQVTTNNKVQQKEQDSEDQQKLEDQQNSKNQKNQKQEIFNNKIKEKKQTFKINGSPTIKYGKYKLPINPVKKGMGANVTFDKDTAILTVTKATTTIIINFKEKTVTVNGVADTNSGIFTASNSKKSTVLIKYIANKLGVRVNGDDDKITVTVPGLDLPKGITVTPVGSTIVENTLNTTTQYMTATANITPGQAVKAELYVGSKLIATDSDIAATDKVVTFTTSDGTPTNTELQAAVPEGGVITVKFNGKNELKSVKIKPEAINPENPASVDEDTIEMLEDLIASAINDATGKISQITQDRLSSITGGMNIPGLL
jgi:DNA-binding protein YbaB